MCQETLPWERWVEYSGSWPQTAGKPIGVWFFVAELKKQQVTRVMKTEYQWLLQKFDSMECQISSNRNGSPSHFTQNNFFHTSWPPSQQEINLLTIRWHWRKIYQWQWLLWWRWDDYDSAKGLHQNPVVSDAIDRPWFLLVSMTTTYVADFCLPDLQTIGTVGLFLRTREHFL